MSAILDKLRKLLALSKSENVHEAAAAAGAAQRLMQEHRIAEAELETGGPTETAQIAADPIDKFGTRSILWKELLCGNLVRLHGCRCWKASNWHNGCMVRQLKIVGRPSDIANVRYLYAWLALEIERLAQRDTKGRGAAFAKSYRVGAVRGVTAAMESADVAVRAEASTAALVKIDARADEASEAMHAAVANLKPARAIKGAFDADGYARGMAAGKSLHTGNKLGASTGARLLKGKP